MVKQIDKNEARLRRHRRVRNKISGTAARPRLDVFRSAKHIYAQIIDDEQGVTLVTSPFVKKQFRNARRRFGTANKNNNSTDDGQSAAEAILIVKAAVEAPLLSRFTVKAAHLHPR